MAIANRYDFVLLFDVTNGNPNGDPDAGNLPRLNPETSQGLVSDVSLKRKIRNYIDLAKSGVTGFNIYVREGAILNEQHRRAYVAQRIGDHNVTTEMKLNPKDDDEARHLRAFMCENFFDVRTFGAVMSTAINIGQVRGPVQITFAQSLEPILPQEISITRIAATNTGEKKRPAPISEDDYERTDARTMGRKYIVPYALYRAHGFISAKLAERTGFSECDLALLREALVSMFEHDRSAARGEMRTRKAIAFKHSHPLGNALAHVLFDRVKIGRNIDGRFHRINHRLDGLPPARDFSDYVIDIDREGLPNGVEIVEWL